MKITQDPSSLFADQNDISLTPSQPTMSDASLFANSLDNEPADVASNGGILHKASEMFDQVNNEKNQLDTTLRRATQSTDPLAMNKAEGQLSNYYLESMMNTKIVSKAVQSLDKITNLQ
ncbi:type III secretion system protein [Pantoea sp. Al-1710]|uniref:Type III secretion system protein n=1 Tax=Candidatus Pantoea communis TaxID=2608354 RepID=A0ABX0RI74_9GAMM|nr:MULTISPECIES: EscI/YscI/HrpB family type III secretion system inner rod protein [Pantoea]NIG12954.1 type III secretion system protein [Pantoea sp. Cy-640]NIG17345.1 type III secretion system protein [Pantoea communis]